MLFKSNRSPYGLGVSLITILITTMVIMIEYGDSTPITITKILAGKKKFKTYSLGISFLPTLVKVKPNKLHMTIRKNQYIRPKKFKMDGSLPLKVPTILMAKRNPYDPPPQDIVLNAQLSLGQDKKSGYDYGYGGYASSEQQPIIETSLQPSHKPPIEIPIPLPQGPIHDPNMQSSIMIENQPLPPPQQSPPPPPTVVQFDDNVYDQQPQYPAPLPPPSSPLPPTAAPAPPPINPNEQRLLLQQHSIDLQSNMGGYDDQSELMLSPPPSEPSAPPQSQSSQSSSNYPPEMPHLPLPNEYKYQGSNRKRMSISDDDNRRSDSSQSPILMLPPPPLPFFPLIPPPPPPMMAPMFPSPSTPSDPPRRMSQEKANSEQTRRQMAMEFTDLVSLPQPQLVPQQTELKEHQPMKINIGEHYDPNMIYVDDQTVPSESQIDEITNEPVPMEDEDLENPDSILGLNSDEPSSFSDNLRQPDMEQSIPNDENDEDQAMAESSIQWVKKYGNKINPYYSYQKKKKYHGDDGPDDFRIEFNLSGPHGGPKVPYGYGDDQDQLNKQLDHIQQSIPVGPYAKSIYKYYLRHTFSEGLRLPRPPPYSFVRMKRLKKYRRPHH